MIEDFEENYFFSLENTTKEANKLFQSNHFSYTLSDPLIKQFYLCTQPI